MYMKPVGCMKNYKQTFHLRHNGSIRGRMLTFGFFYESGHKQGRKKNNPPNISPKFKSSTQEIRTWIINISTRSNGVELQSGSISAPQHVPVRRYRHDEGEQNYTRPVKVNQLLGWRTQCITFSVSRVLLSKMKEIQVRTTSSRRALLKTELLFPVMDTEAEESRESQAGDVFCN